MSSSEAVLNESRAARSLPSRQLIEQPTPANLSELLWRVAMPLMCLLQMLLAVPLGFVNPRRGRGMNMMIALLLAITYSNLIGILQGVVASGRSSFGMAWWPIHLAVLLLTAVLFFWRDNTNSRWHPARLLGMLRNALLIRRKEAA